MHFGLGPRDEAVDVTVYEPGGDVAATAEDLPVDAYHDVELAD